MDVQTKELYHSANGDRWYPLVMSYGQKLVTA